ncbi:MAG: glucose 1-dehydrogenase [Pseudomonadota bacterium]|uniref:SDR family NAD(P)-dependent oxidoreductase n=1 Tax=Gallaecimonas pentaromativorans TaxID=584787 RepID=UPI00067F6633|nr:glucose 1-dehydrogenase [Gallaecimonas pentaromativorans]MED5524292.1 glucose 1-dehydrogenase [Pseudomonadota bacterium]
MSLLDTKVAVITGGSSGIGLATAKRFVAQGAYVYITGRRQSELDKAVAEIGGNVTAVQGDVASLSDLDRLFGAVKARHGRVDVLFANAGLVEHQKLGEITETHFDKTFNANVRGLLFTMQKALPLMQDGGAVILTGSIAGIKGLPAHGTYSASKAAVRSFARTWAAEFKDKGIRVNVISPGAIDTPIIDGQADTQEGADQLRANFAAATPLGRIGKAEEVADAALFLASSQSSFMTGAEIFVDGGIAQV